MRTINSILVLTDFSDTAAASYRYALQLADDLGASVQLLHCLPAATAVAGHGPMVVDTSPVLYEQAEAQLQTFITRGLDELEASDPEPPEVAGTISPFGLREGITRHAEENHVDLIVVGTHGVQDEWDRFFGTNAAFLVGKVAPPILIVPDGVDYQPLRSVCFATELRENDLGIAEWLSEVLTAYSPAVNFLHVDVPGKGQTAAALDLFRRVFEQPRPAMATTTFTTVFNDDVTDGIFSFLAKQPHDLLVMVKPRRSWWERTFAHSETKESAGITGVPLLVVGETDG